jgi:hypothetical protein
MATEESAIVPSATDQLQVDTVSLAPWVMGAEDLDTEVSLAPWVIVTEGSLLALDIQDSISLQDTVWVMEVSVAPVLGEVLKARFT